MRYCATTNLHLSGLSWSKKRRSGKSPSRSRPHRRAYTSESTSTEKSHNSLRSTPQNVTYYHSQRMGQTTSSTQHHPNSSSSAACPVDHSAFAKHPQVSPSAPASCPVDHVSLAKNAQSSSPVAGGCPVDHASLSKPSSTTPSQCPVQPETLDPRNHLPILTQERVPSQTLDLPTDRTKSSIPRDTTGNWEYPSPQQFYSALVRKGWETPENEIETMVQIHNFLNEKAWEEVHRWEAQVNKCVVSPL